MSNLAQARRNLPPIAKPVIVVILQEGVVVGIEVVLVGLVGIGLGELLAEVLRVATRSTAFGMDF